MTSNVAKTGLARDLAERASEKDPIRIGLIGCGEMGTDIVSRTVHMEGIEVAAIANLTPDNAHAAVRIAYGTEGHSRSVSRTAGVDGIIEGRQIAVTDDSRLILESGLIDVVVDATGIPSVGADVGIRAMQAGKHVVMMNVEADVTVGVYLSNQAKRHGVVYSLGAGDEPTACMELFEFVSAMGHRVVAAGKGKNNPLRFDAVPDQYVDEARRRNMNVRMLVEFVEGSKTMVEMAAIANATGLVPDKPGMHGPSATLDELNSVLIPSEDGGILSGIGRVDYTVGKGVAPGVFVIAEMKHPRIRERMADLKMGKGPYYTFYRPYHLTSLEVPLTCARAALYGRADMTPLELPVAEVCAVAKRDLRPGEVLGQIGETDYRAWTIEFMEAKAAGAIPCGLLTGGVVTDAVECGDLLTHSNTRVCEADPIVSIRRLQDELVDAALASS